MAQYKQDRVCGVWFSAMSALTSRCCWPGHLLFCPFQASDVYSSFCKTSRSQPIQGGSGKLPFAFVYPRLVKQLRSRVFLESAP